MTTHMSSIPDVWSPATWTILVVVCICIVYVTTPVHVAVGSLSGLLSVYNPTEAKYSPKHVLVQEQFDTPILSIQLGQFTSYVCDVICTTAVNHKN